MPDWLRQKRDPASGELAFFVIAVPCQRTFLLSLNLARLMSSATRVCSIRDRLRRKIGGATAGLSDAAAHPILQAGGHDGSGGGGQEGALIDS